MVNDIIELLKKKEFEMESLIDDAIVRAAAIKEAALEKSRNMKISEEAGLSERLEKLRAEEEEGIKEEIERIHKEGEAEISLIEKRARKRMGEAVSTVKKFLLNEE